MANEDRNTLNMSLFFFNKRFFNKLSDLELYFYAQTGKKKEAFLN